jgi:small subunit ribosomal protein S2
MSIVSMKQLLETGVHFGHRAKKWDPRMKPFIFTERNGIHIIDLQQTLTNLEEAYALVRNAVSEGQQVLFVGTKRQAQEAIQQESQRCFQPFVTERWLGGTLTNWRTIKSRIDQLKRFEEEREKGGLTLLTKKERMIRDREIEKLQQRLGGLREMRRLPAMLFVVDVKREQTAVQEANALSIPVIAMVDTNCNPEQIDYVIPSNDDAIRAIKLLAGKIADAALEGINMRKATGNFDDQAAMMDASMGGKYDEDSDEEDLLTKSTLARAKNIDFGTEDE